MKRLLTICLAVLFWVPSVQAANGSFLILKSVHFYPNADKSGKRILTRKRQAYDVVSIEVDQSGSLMFKILIPEKSIAINGSGFILETDGELQDLGYNEVKVYPEVPRKNQSLTRYQAVPSNQLSFTGRQRQSPDFPNIFWRAVNYKAKIPIQYWIPEWAGIYRPDKDATWLNRTYEALMKEDLNADLVNKILLGLVEPGFSMDQVRWALGEPLKEAAIEDNTKLEWLYQSRKIIFQNERVLRVL